MNAANRRANKVKLQANISKIKTTIIVIIFMVVVFPDVITGRAAYKLILNFYHLLKSVNRDEHAAGCKVLI